MENNLKKSFWQLELKLLEKDKIDVIEFFNESGALGYHEVLYEENVTNNLQSDYHILNFYFNENFPIKPFLIMSMTLLKVEDYKSELSLVKYEDFLKSFQETFRKFKISDKIWILPPWDSKLENKEDIGIIINPSFAFGTGKHETTVLMAEYLSRKSLDGLSIVDMGCGSGILSLIALKLGAKSVMGIDVENLSVESAQSNFLLNKEAGILKTGAQFIEGDFSTYETLTQDHPCDIFLANIIPGVFYQNKSDLQKWINHSTGWALSGIAENQIEKFKKWLEEVLPDSEYAIAENNGWFIIYR